MINTCTFKKLFFLPAICVFTILNVSAGPGELAEYMRANLFSNTGSSPVLLDGNLTQYSDGYSNTIDYNDAWKLTNFGENFGISRNGVTLVIERRKRFQFGDTSVFRMWNMARKDYMIELIAQNCNHPNVTAYVEDMYLNTQTQINCNGTTRINFTVDQNAGSSQENRFRLIFKFNPLNHLPFSFGEVRATRNNGQARFQWKVNNENAQVRYEVEKSSDGSQFAFINEVVPQNMGESPVYEFTDAAAYGDELYRVKTIDIDNNVSYSQVARLFNVHAEEAICIYPNPVINKVARFFMNVKTSGKYSVILFGDNGGAVYRTSMNIEAGQSNYSIAFPSAITPGIYLIQLVGPEKTRITKMISIQ